MAGKVDQKQIDALRAARWKGRTDLGWLCRNVLGYKDVSDNNFQPGDVTDNGPHLPIHQPLIDTVQKFPIPTPEQAVEHDKFVNGKWEYKPLMPLTRLPGHRRTLILDARGFLKSTINTMAHAIQWIINYPDVAIMVVQSNGKKAIDFTGEIKKHFQFNPKFRQLYPEHCPQKNINDFGTRVEFVSCARNPAVIRKEPTVMASSIDQGMSGMHFDVIKCSDIVDPSNINGEGLSYVKRMFGYLQPLLVAPGYWLDVEGTRYHADDTYGKIIAEEKAALPEDRQYKMYIRSCFQRVPPAGQTPQFTVDELKWPFKLDENGKRMSWWPERFTSKYYERMATDDPFVFATQQLNDPSAVGGTKPFPVGQVEVNGKTKTLPAYITRKDFVANVPVDYREIIIDTAETDGKRSDYSVLTVASWDSNYGRVYIERIVRGRFLTDELIKKIIALSIEFRPRKIKIEETGYVRGLMSSLLREVQKTNRLSNLNLTVETIKRENRQAKHERILQSIQPWYMSGDLRFLDDFDRYCPGVTEALETELDTFPGKNDDILDTLADVFQNKKYFGRVRPRKSEEDLQHLQQQALKAMLTGPRPEWDEPWAGGSGGTGSGYEL